MSDQGDQLATPGEPSDDHHIQWPHWSDFFPRSPRTWGTVVVTTLASGALLVILVLRLWAAANGVSASAVSPLVGRSAPDFTIQTWTWDGSSSVPIHLAALKGHPVIVNFWASWCVACREEEPLLEADWLKYKTQGVLFIGVAFEDTQQDGAAFLQAYGVTFPSGPDTTGEIAIDYGVTGVPETVFIDRQGVIKQKDIGALDDGGLRQSIQQLLHEP